MIAALVGLIGSLFMTPVLVLLGAPVIQELTLMVLEGVVLTAVTYGLLEFMKQKGWRT